jgi:hypothetical protein
MGRGFVGAGAGVFVPLGVSHGPLLELKAMYMLGTSGFVAEPSLGYGLGF